MGVERIESTYLLTQASLLKNLGNSKSGANTHDMRRDADNLKKIGNETLAFVAISGE